MVGTAVKIFGLMVTICSFVWGMVLIFDYLVPMIGYGFSILSLIIFPFWLLMPFYEIYTDGHFQSFVVMYGGSTMGLIMYFFGDRLH